MRSELSVSDRILLSPLWMITLLPLPLLFGISDFLFLTVYYGVRYRRNLVLKNLSNSLPEKDRKEIKEIARRFFRYLCNYFVESIYLWNMNKTECNRRYRFTNLEVIHNLASKKKNIILATSHYGNWEWANNLNNLSPYENSWSI
jgi:KDO2-lipid IV(A) lauroyltransferase